MTATYNSLTRVDYGSRTNTTTNTPANTLAGDLLLLFCVTANSGTAVTPTWPPSGWTSFGSTQTDTDGSFGDRMSMAWRIAAGAPGSGEATSHTVTHASTNCETLMVLVKGSGTLSIDAFSQATNTIGANAVSATSVTATAADDLLLYIAINWDEVAWTPPTGMTERQDAQFIYFASEALSASGATGTRAVNSGGTTTNPWMANLVAILDTPGGGGSVVGSRNLGGLLQGKGLVGPWR